MKKSITILGISIFLIIPQADAALQTRAVEYRHGDTLLEGYLAYDDAVSGARPGVLVIHEWKGLGDYAKKRAEMLAELGYVAFAADMYGKGVYADSHEEAGKLSGVFRQDRTLMRERAKAGLDILLGQEGVDASRIAAIGYCFGGSTVLEMARSGMPLQGVVSFHGGLSTPMPAEEGEIKAKVLVMHGNDDPHVSQEEVIGLKNEMNQAGADWQMIIFGNAVHSFTVPEAGDDPSKGIAYNAKADARSWDYMLEFFEDILA